MSTARTIAILGGTGELGSGLAKKWAAAGYKIVVGSRSAERAVEAAAQIAAETGAGSRVEGADNLAAAERGDIVLVAVPWSNHDAVLSEAKPVLAGKVVIDAVVPLVPPKVSTVQLPEGGSAARRAQDILGMESRVVGAFHNVAAKKLHDSGHIECDILVCGDDKDAREEVIGLASAAGLRGIDAGVLANSAASEALTSLLIGINRRYKVPGAGIRITGIGEPLATE